jgi:hypothetical protein
MMKLRLLFATGLCLAWATFAVALAPGMKPAEAEPEAKRVPAAAIKIPLVRHLRLVIRPTILGLVPPDNTQHLGEVFVRVTEILPGLKLTARYEIKEQGLWDKPGEEGEEPPKRQKPAVRFRRGFFTARSTAASPAVLPPLLWGDGDFASDGGVLWLPRAVFDELKTGGGVDWDPAFGDAALAEELQRLYPPQEQEDGAEAPAVRLELTSRSVQYPVDVNGERTRLMALAATDSLGASEYIILDDPDNPLLLKLSYSGEDTAGGGLLESGAGYAVVSIDF